MTPSYEEKLEESHPFFGRLHELSDEPSAIQLDAQGHHYLNKYLLSIHALLIIAYSLTYIFVTRSKFTSPSHPSGILPLPGREAVHWELRPFTTSLVNNPFAGTPRSELDLAWHNLMKNNHIKISHKRLESLNLTSIQLRNGSGDIASLGTFHALHCLKKIRQMTYKEYYHHGKDGAQMYREQVHSDHCIEYIREYLMCKPDLSLVTYHWINNTAQHPEDPSLRLPTSWDHSLHECANWDALDAWAGARVFDLYKYDLLQRPE